MLDRSIQRDNSHLRPVRAAFLLSAILLAGFSLSPGPAGGAEILTLEQWLDLGWDYYNAGDVEEAFNTFLQAVEEYPESAEARLALGEMYLELGVVDRGRAELLNSLQLDDTSPLAARTHYLYAFSIREEDPTDALRHLERAHHLGGTPSLQFEIGRQVRFCRLLMQMPGRSESGPIVLHYPFYVLTFEEGDAIARNAEASCYLVESFCYFDLTEPTHFFLYPSERALRAEVLFQEGEMDPGHHESHTVYSPNLDLLPHLCTQIVFDLQEELNRHAGADWVARVLPTAVTGSVQWENPGESPGEVLQGVDCDDAVRALVADGSLVNLEYFRSEEYSPYIDPGVEQAELGSFLRWVRRTYDRTKLQELITQPNLEIILDAETAELQTAWLQDLGETSSLIADTERAERWAQSLEPSPLSRNPDLPMEVLKEGIRLYLDGHAASGKRKIHQALEIDAALGLGYYTLGWIACREGDWQEAEEHLTMAVLLLERPEEIAWCHTMLAPIYLHQARWRLAQGSLLLVADTIQSEAMRSWAGELLERVNHIINLDPEPLERESAEFDAMRDFIAVWNQAANSEEGTSHLISPMMDSARATELAAYYASIRKQYPSVVFNHALRKVGREGAALHTEIAVQAAFPGVTRHLPPHLEALRTGEHLRYLHVMPSDDGWLVVDWEDGWFPLEPLRHIPSPAIETSEQEEHSE